MAFIESILVLFSVIRCIRTNTVYKKLTSSSREIHGISLVKLITSQEPRDLGATIVQQGYKLSFILLYGHSRLDRPNEKLCSSRVTRSAITSFSIYFGGLNIIKSLATSLTCI